MSVLNYILAVVGIILMAASDSFVIPFIGMIVFTLGVFPAILDGD